MGMGRKARRKRRHRLSRHNSTEERARKTRVDHVLPPVRPWEVEPEKTGRRTR